MPYEEGDVLKAGVQIRLVERVTISDLVDNELWAICPDRYGCDLEQWLDVVGRWGIKVEKMSDRAIWDLEREKAIQIRKEKEELWAKWAKVNL